MVIIIGSSVSSCYNCLFQVVTSFFSFASPSRILAPLFPNMESRYIFMAVRKWLDPPAVLWGWLGTPDHLASCPGLHWGEACFGGIVLMPPAVDCGPCHCLHSKVHKFYKVSSGLLEYICPLNAFMSKSEARNSLLPSGVCTTGTADASNSLSSKRMNTMLGQVSLRCLY